VPVVTLFVRSENDAAIGLYEKVGMRKVLEYRSVLF
jgi:ribosomal protein S18 acetylase RimI-like enzyme